MSTTIIRSEDIIRNEPDEVRVRALGAQLARERGLDPADLAPIRGGRPTAALSARLDEQRAVFNMLHERGFTYGQIAAAFGHHEVTIKRIVYRAKN